MADTGIIKVKDRFPWRKNQIRDVLIFAVIALIGVAGTVYGAVVPSDSWPTPVFYVLGGIALLVVLISLIGNNVLKNNSSMHAELDPETYKVSVWMKKPTKAIWGDKLNRGRNSGDLKELQVIDAQKVGKYNNLVFKLENDKNIYLPDRLYNHPETRDFLLKFIESRNGNVPAASRQAMEQLAGVLNAGRNLQPKD